MKPLRVETAKRFAKTIGADGVVVLAFTRDQFAHTTYGRNRQDCTTMRHLAEYIMAKVGGGRLDPWDPPVQSKTTPGQDDEHFEKQRQALDKDLNELLF